MAREAENMGGLGGSGADRSGSASHSPLPETERLLTPAEVAAMFRVDPKTVTRWARDGRLSAVRTLGGHRRYREAEVLSLLRAAHGTDTV